MTELERSREACTEQDEQQHLRDAATLTDAPRPRELNPQT